MKRVTVLAFATLAALMLTSCGVKQMATESALSQAEVDYAAIRPQAEKIAPESASAIEKRIAAIKDLLNRGDLQTAAPGTRDLQAQIHGLAEELPTRRALLEATWKELNAQLSGPLASLDPMLRLRSPAPAAMPPTELRAARAELEALKMRWKDAQTSWEDGQVFEAVAQAKDVQKQLAHLSERTSEGS